MRNVATVALLIAFPFSSASSAHALQDWPHLRGPEHDGRAPSSPSLARDGFALSVAWRAPLGPAYSGIAIADQVVVTLSSNGAVDDVVALSADDGRVLWRTPLGPHYRGHDGSEDGPISSPAIADETVFAVDARGRFVALDLSDGSPRWAISLPDELGTELPEYGFTSSPLVAGGRVVLQGGGDAGRSLCAFDVATGELAWALGDGGTGYRSPALLELCGRRQIVAVDGPEVLGIDPASGEVLWTHALEENEEFGSGLPTPIDGQRFCAPIRGSLTAFAVEPDEAGYRVTELWSSRDLGRGYAAPVARDGYLYGLQGEFLTCVDAATGRRVWKSRPPGGRGLIAVGDRLVVYGAQGVVAVARATPEGYDELARVQALAHTSYTWPSFARDRIFVRNSSELCALEAVDRGRAVVAGAERDGEPPPESTFARFVAEVEAADDKEARIDAFLAEHPVLPLVEDGWAHVVFVGDVEDLAIAGTMIDGSRADSLRRIAGTNFHYRSYPIEPGARFEYRFHVDFQEWRSDPLNPHRVPARWGADMSEIATPEYRRASHYEEPEGGARGRLETFEFASESLGNERRVAVWLPPGYDDGDAAYPLLIVQRGQDWIEKGRLTSSLDNLVGERVRPLIVAFVEPIGQWWFEAGGTGTEEYIAMLADELVPHLSERYRLTDDPAERAILGTEGFGLTAAYAVLLRNDCFGQAAARSVALGDRARHAFFDLVENGPRCEASFYVDWNRWSGRNKDRAYDYGAESRRVAEALEAAGYPVAGGEALDSYGWGSLRARTDAVLEALFPL